MTRDPGTPLIGDLDQLLAHIHDTHPDNRRCPAQGKFGFRGNLSPYRCRLPYRHEGLHDWVKDDDAAAPSP